MADPYPLLKAHTLTVGAPTGESSQPPEDEWLGTPDDAITPPVPLDSLVKLSGINAIRSACVDAIARNTVGLGYSLEVEFGHEKEVADPSADIRKATTLLESLAARDKRLDSPTFTDLLMAVKKDEETCGQGFIEVSRDRRSGQISGLFHLPGHRMRRLKSRDGYVLVPPTGDMTRATRYYNFGEKVTYSRDGLPQGSLAKGRNWQTNEVICWKLYAPEDRDYGLPRDVAMVLEYLGDKLAAESNISFFDSSGTPPTVLFVQGEEQRDGSKISFRVPQQTVDSIANTLKADGGHRHRVAIIPVPPGTTTKEVKLGEISERDMGFGDFREANARRTLAAMRLQPIFIPAVEDASRYTAEVQRAITLEQLFDPEQKRYEARIGETLLRELGYAHLRLVLRRLAVEDDATRRDSADKMAENGVITRRELRKAHGFGPLPEAPEGQEPTPGQVPFGWNDELVQTGPPRGAENRGGAVDTRGLQDGIGGRPISDREEIAKSMAQIAKAMPAPPPVRIEVPIKIDRGAESKKIVRDEQGLISEVISA